MSDENKPHDVLNETAVFDYVAGNQSDENRANFERLIADNQPLRDAVADEQALRTALKDYARSSPTPSHISSENFQNLLEQIDQLAAESDDDLTFLPPKESSKWSVIGGVAATLLLCATLFLDWYSQNNGPTPEATVISQPELGALISEQRVFEITFKHAIDQETIHALMQRYQLRPLSQTGSAWLVYSEAPVSLTQLAAINNESATTLVREIGFKNR